IASPSDTREFVRKVCVVVSAIRASVLGGRSRAKVPRVTPRHTEIRFGTIRRPTTASWIWIDSRIRPGSESARVHRLEHGMRAEPAARELGADRAAVEDEDAVAYVGELVE